MVRNSIAKFEKQTDIELTFAIVTTLEDRDIESYANNLFKQWGVGKKDRNNGLLVVIAPNERKWRVEVGYGLETYLTDYQSQELAEVFKPNFRAGNYFAGIDAFIDATTKHLGNSTWEDRLSYKVKQDKASHEYWVNFWLYFLYAFLSIIGLIITVFAFVKFKAKIEREKAFNAKKERRLTSYKEKVDNINNILISYKLNAITADNVLLTLIANSKDDDELTTNFNKSIDSLLPHTDLIQTISELTSSINELDKVYNSLNRNEKRINITETKKPEFTIDTNSRIDSLKSTLVEVRKNISLFNDKSDRIAEFDKLAAVILSIEDISDARKLEGEYTTDPSTMSNYSTKLRQAANQFNIVDKSFDNLDNMRKLYSDYKFIQDDLYSYLGKISDKNRQHESMVNTLRSSKSTLDNHNSKLNRYLTESDVSYSTKTAIKSFIAGMILFKVTSDVLGSFKDFTSISSQAEKLANKAQSDIDEEERKRRRKKEEERKRREEEDSRRASYSSSSSSSSWSSSSSFGGLGGGDSGGGGSSGSW